MGWIAPAFVPELAARLAEGESEVALGGAWVRLAVSVPEPASPGPAAPTRPLPPEPGPTRPEPAARPMPPEPAPSAPPVATLSYTSLGAYARCGYRFYARRVLGAPPAPVPAAPGPALLARRAADRGVLLHALLEHLDFRRPTAPTPKAIALTAAGAGLPGADGQEADEFAALVTAFATSELGAPWPCDRRREERFAFELDGVLINGAIDVLASATAPRWSSTTRVIGSTATIRLRSSRAPTRPSGSCMRSRRCALVHRESSRALLPRGSRAACNGEL